MIHSSPFVISQLSPDKRIVLRPLLQKSWAETYAKELGEQPAAKMIDTLASNDIGGLVPNNDEAVFIATQEDHILGCAISATRHNVTYLWGFYVLAEFQRQGIGRSLLQHSVSACEPTNTVQLTVLKSSVEAVKFYQALGFKTQSEEEFEILIGHMAPSIIMAAPISVLVHHPSKCKPDFSI